MGRRIRDHATNILTVLADRNVSIEYVTTRRIVAHLKLQLKYEDKFEILKGITITSKYQILDHGSKIKHCI